jgi:hypothetical protein
MTHFHVTLPSDNSLDTYPSNTASRFTVKLPDRIELNGDYEVGLAELMYPHTWFNFDNSDGRFHVFIRVSDKQMKKFVFRSGYYPDASELVVDLNQQISKALTEIDRYNPVVRFSFNPSSLKMSLLNNSRNLLFFSSTILEYLGFTKLGRVNLKVPTMADEIFDIHRGRNLMYVYCDVAAHSPVGDIETPLLRVCNTSGNDGEMVRTIFTHPHYVPVSRTDFQTIEINISDEIGRPIPFMHGKSLVTLHFRQRNALSS